MSTAFTSHRFSRTATLVVALGAAVTAMAACGPDEGAGSAGGMGYLATSEGAIVRDELAVLAEDQCAAENEEAPLDVETLPQSDVNQRVTLLASQNALPEMFVGSTPELRPGGLLGDDQTVVNLETALDELGALDDFLPAAIDTVKNIYGGRFVSVPFQFNIEGFFYNKGIFADLGIEPPQTWDDFLAASDAMQAAGIQPFAVSGSQAWTVLRYIGNYIFRSLGPDAMQRVADGEARLTDPEYVEAIAAIGDLSTYLGPGIETVDIQTATSQLLTGTAGMMYYGSAILGDINDEELNQVGPDAFGFTPFPAVEGGAGSIEQYPANTGVPTVLSAPLYTPGVGDWLACIAEYFGSSVMNNQGVISGFELNQPVDDLPPLTAEIQQIMGQTTETVLWFEALFGPRAATAAGENAVPLITGDQTAEQFAEIIQSAIDADAS